MPSRIFVVCHRDFNNRRQNVDQLHDNNLGVGTAAAIVNLDLDRNRRILFVVKPVALFGCHDSACRHIKTLTRIFDESPGERIAVFIGSFQGIHHRTRVRIFPDLNGIRDNLRNFIHIIDSNRNSSDNIERRIVLVGQFNINCINMRFGFVIKFLLGLDYAFGSNREVGCVAADSGKHILSVHGHGVVFTPFKSANDGSRNFMFVDIKFLIVKNRIFVDVANRDNNRRISLHLIVNIFDMNLNIDILNLFKIKLGRILDANRTIFVNRNKVTVMASIAQTILAFGATKSTMNTAQGINHKTIQRIFVNRMQSVFFELERRKIRITDFQSDEPIMRAVLQRCCIQVLNDNPKGFFSRLAVWTFINFIIKRSQDDRVSQVLAINIKIGLARIDAFRSIEQWNICSSDISASGKTIGILAIYGSTKIKAIFEIDKSCGLFVQSDFNRILLVTFDQISLYAFCSIQNRRIERHIAERTSIKFMTNFEFVGKKLTG